MCNVMVSCLWGYNGHAHAHDKGPLNLADAVTQQPPIRFIPIRKSKDYVYGIWVYKAFGMWKGYYRVKQSLVSYVKPWTEARNNKYMKYHSKLTYQLSFWNVSRKVDYHAGGKWFIHGPKRRKENQLLSLKHLTKLSSLEPSWPVDAQRHGHLPIGA